MNPACVIAAQLLETDPDDINPKDYLEQLDADKLSGVVNAITAQDARVFYSRTHTYARSSTPIQVRRNGRTKYWKREPARFSVPVKYGFRDCFYIDNNNANKWSTIPLPIQKKEL
jgi:hypothetical protein